MAHTILVSKTNYHASQWHIAKLPSSSTKRCWAMQTNTCILCNAKFSIGRHDSPIPTYKGLKKEPRSTNNMEHELLFCLLDINQCESGNIFFLNFLYLWFFFFELTYNSQHLANDGIYQSIAGGRVCVWGHWISTAVEGGTFTTFTFSSMTFGVLKHQSKSYLKYHYSRTLLRLWTLMRCSFHPSPVWKSKLNFHQQNHIK